MIYDIYAYQEMPVDLDINGATLTDWLELPEIHRILNNKYQFYGVYKLDGLNVNYFEKGNFVKAKWIDGTYQFFEINTPVKNLNSLSITGRHIAYIANRNFIEYSFTARGDGIQIMSHLQESLAFPQKHIFISDVETKHQFTAKEVKPLEAIMGSNNGSQNLVGVTDSELDMNNWELKLSKRIGEDKGFRIDFGHNLESVEETIDSDSVINSLYLVGGTPENDYDEEKNPIVFKYLEVSGVTDENRRIGKRQNSEIVDIEELKKWGQSLFDKDRIHEPKVTHDVSMVSLENSIEYKDVYKNLTKLGFGDTAHVYVPKLGIDIQERLVECVWYPTIQKYKSMTLGNDLNMYTYQSQTETQVVRNELSIAREVLVENVKNATAWITGNKEGYVLFRPEKAPREILIMDNPDASKAKEVWRWNLGGLGHSKNGIDGPYETAITQDGRIVADFIKAGILNGVRVQAENVNYLIDMYNGQIVFYDVANPNDKISLGRLASTISGTTGRVNGTAIIQEPGYIFSLNSQSKTSSNSTPIVQIPADSHSSNRLLNLYGKVNLEGEFYINGVKVTPGGTGGGDGGWNGQYPAEIITQADKFAWQLWQYLLSQGYSKQAAAGILGNASRETGGTMNPDTDQIGGPAYGIVQWDGSAYPLVGSPTYNGREYVQRLMNAAGITDDYRTMTAQGKLIEWSMFNGQWIGAVSPTTVAGFKATTSVENATFAFLKNYERAGVEELGQRVAAANDFYNRFKDLKQPGGKYALPVLQGTRVTSWFGPRGGKMHNGIDFGGATGDPIFAAQDGTVWLSEFDPDMGEWILIKHDDGYMTGYAHNSQRLVGVGTKVSKGQQIARMGSTGDSTGPHLHFSVQTAKWSGYVDPAPFIGLTPP